VHAIPARGLSPSLRATEAAVSRAFDTGDAVGCAVAWIETLEPDDPRVDGRLRRLYRAAVDPESGTLDAILKVHSLRPDTLRAHLALWRATCRTAEGLSRRERECIALVVSAYNECHY
jgi:hypothetical protein